MEEDMTGTEQENKEWIDSIDYVIKHEEPGRASEIIDLIRKRVLSAGIDLKPRLNTPYLNTIPSGRELPYPGNRELERKIKSIIRWNAMAMVVQANRKKEGIGGHISTFASAATLYEVGFNHFFKGGGNDEPADIIYFQGHASPGMYARSFLEGRFSETTLENFRRELNDEGGLSSYPHPRLMTDYWQFPTVSMGLSPLMAIYQARFNKYLQDNGVIEINGQKVWAFLGDGEMDEPESMGALTLASREELDNLIFVINCNLQRLDGPVRGNGSIIKELESAFAGAGWNVIKIIHGANWDPLLEKDKDGLIEKRFSELVDGQLQKLSTADGAYIRKEFFGKNKELLAIAENLSDEELSKLARGGHDPLKVYNAYKAAVENKGSPTVILALTIKGYGLGEAGEGRNITHQQKKLNEDELMHFRDRFNIPISDDEVASAPFYRPAEDSEEIRYMKERREKLGGFLPRRNCCEPPAFIPPEPSLYDDFMKGSGNHTLATTMVAVQLLSKLLKDKNVGKLIVPIVPDESRTFGMDSLFRQAGIYSHKGQLYEPVDRESLLYYKEARNGAILEEGITEAGSMSSFIAAGTSYATHNVKCIPFFIFYSMFGFQRVGDLIWAAADARARGFLIGGTAGRTTLAGEGLQHQDGHSHLLAMSVPPVQAYDPAFSYEVAVIIREGIRRMYEKGEDIFYYITVTNEKYNMPAMPVKNAEEGIIKGMYLYKKARSNKHRLNLLGSGAILNEALKAAEILKNDYKIDADVWSVTSYKKLYENAFETERKNRLNGSSEKNYIQECFGNDEGIFVAASDYVKLLPLSISSWFKGWFTALGTDGFGLSDHRDELREYFEVNASHIAWSALLNLEKAGKIESSILAEAKKRLSIDSGKRNPFRSTF